MQLMGPAVVELDQMVTGLTPDSGYAACVFTSNSQGVAKSAVLRFATVNPLPRFVSIAPAHAACGEPYSYTPSVTGDGPFSFSLVSGPAEMTADPTTGEVRWMARHDEGAEVVLQVTGAAGSAQQTFDVAVDCEVQMLGVRACSVGPGVPLVLVVLLLTRRRRAHSAWH
jgi:hypothetical protein